MIQVKFKWGDGPTQVIKYPTMIKKLKHNGKRPTNLTVDANMYNVRIVEWINECHFTLESAG